MTQPAPRSRVIAIVSLAVIACIAAAALAVGTILGGPGNETSALPPCEQLPALEEGQRALAQHGEAVTAIEALGEEVTVAAVDPCDGTGRGAIRITYRTPAELEAVRDYLNGFDGFGVPVQIAPGR